MKSIKELLQDIKQDVSTMEPNHEAWWKHNHQQGTYENNITAPFHFFERELDQEIKANMRKSGKYTEWGY